MAKFHDCEQYSDEWERLRLGIPTASNFDKIITPEGKPSKQWKKYAYQLLAERFIDRKLDKYQSKAMEIGMMMENDAAEDYEIQEMQEFPNIQVKKIGCILNDAGTAACSPDRLVIIGEEMGLLQIKCPNPDTQMEYLLEGVIAKDYKPQLQGELLISGLKWTDIYGYNPELPRSRIRVERDEIYIACLDNLLKEFNDFLDKAFSKIQSMQPIRKGSKFYVSPTLSF